MWNYRWKQIDTEKVAQYDYLKATSSLPNLKKKDLRDDDKNYRW